MSLNRSRRLIPTAGLWLLGVLVALGAAGSARAQVARKLFRAPVGGTNLLQDVAWHSPAGRKALREGDAFVCDNGPDARAVNGLYQSVVLDQKTPQPIIAVAWSKADAVTGSRDSDYSLYLDLRYQDGTPLWGQSSAFEVGTHDWQKVVVKIVPAKPVKEVAVNLLMRRHGGKVAFRGAELKQVELAAGATMFDGVMIDLAGSTGGEGFSVRDVAADGDFVRFDKGQALGLKLSTQEQPVVGGRRYAVRLEDTTGADRAVTLVFSRKLEAGGWDWLIDPRRSEKTACPQEYQQARRTHAGHDGRLGWYPLAAVTRAFLPEKVTRAFLPDVPAPNQPQAKKDQDLRPGMATFPQRPGMATFPQRPGMAALPGHAICLDMEHPAVFRTGYNAATNELFIAFDLGLTKERPAAQTAFASLDFDPAWGFRGAVAAMYAAFPDQFRLRVQKQGVWMPFGRISKVQGWEDFGFAFKEGNDETVWDDQHGILTFRYTEPMTWWMSMPKDAPRTYQAALAQARSLADKGDRHAQALFSSGMYDEHGKLVCRLLDTPWCNGAVWSMTTAPGIPGAVTDWKNKWNPHIREGLYGPKRKGDLDGEYVDSSEGYVTAEMNFRREHFAAMEFPLSFDSATLKPAIFRGLVAGEYVAQQARDVHAMGKLMMANGAPTSLCWLTPHLDVMGTETDWNHGGRWQPMSDAEMLYRRTLCGPKPYCFLMNTNFDKWGYAQSEKFMKRCLAYGMFPGYFSADASTKTYFANKDLYDRDRPLFLKYVPLCRQVAQAAWQPITLARSSDPKVYVERWGKSYLTIFNDSPDRRTATVRLDPGLSAAGKNDLVSGKPLDWKGAGLTITVDGQDVALIEVK